MQPSLTRRRLAAVVLGLWLTVVGMEAAAAVPEACSGEVVIVVSPGNPVSELTRSQVIDIFLGKSGIFPDGRRAVPVDQSESTRVRSVFAHDVLGRSLAQVRAHWAKMVFTGRGRPPREAPSCGDVKRLVAGNPNAIGYIDRTHLDDSVSVVAVE